jgi:hypothetical protein
MQIHMHDENGLISTGTGFFYSHAGEWFLITNWHNLSGRHFLSDMPLTSKRLPTFIEIKTSSYSSELCSLSEGSFTTVCQRIDIYRDYTPLWFEHPTLGPKCDVVALPLARSSLCPEFMHNAANLISLIEIPVKPGSPVFIIGFPKSISIGFGLPLWKSGYIASEPFYDVTVGGTVSCVGGLQGGMQLPAIFLDSLTREGMSGSPVFAQFFGNWDMSDPYKSLDLDDPQFWNRDDVALGEKRMQFIGCYSGRVRDDEEKAALGLCWKESAIQIICDTRKTGKHPHIK